MTIFHYPHPMSQDIIQDWYFAPLLPWQMATWQYLTSHFPDLPHAMLFAGNAGTGKRAFVYRLIAWALCQNQSHQGACGECESCTWLKSGTHPNIFTIPKPIQPLEETRESKKSATTKKSNNLQDSSPNHATSHSIKIDEIREMQPFAQHSSEGYRFIILHQADSMTLGAGNALLKTLEEPSPNVFLILISDTPSRILPTIRSRLQQFSVSHMTPQQAMAYISQHLDMALYSMPAIEQVLAVSNFSPLVAMDMLTSDWYQQRQIWLNSWQAIRTQSRLPIQASDYWQNTLTLSDFLYLSGLMLVELAKVIGGLPTIQQDIDWRKLEPLPNLMTVHTLQHAIEQVWQDRRQHIQDKLCYDNLMYKFSFS